ncbi:hypothetical protein [Pseudomonas aeruginosa]|uniref:hypothetical protein n=1 Tax=Pseudomonas aeruginosa TaxID=287 RepID=UPI0039184950
MTVTGPSDMDFLAAYTAVNVKSCCQVLASIFLAAYTAVNVSRVMPCSIAHFLAAYTAVN